MAPIDFKLSKPFESTRRVSFPEPPSWSTLAARIGYLFDVPEERVGVSYFDQDGDEITLSSDGELQEYYAQPGVIGPNATTIRLTVQDLGPNARRPMQPPQPQARTSLFGGSGGTFGGNPPSFGVFRTLDNDWQRIGSLHGPIDELESEGPHAYVESVYSSDHASQSNKRNSVLSTLDTDFGHIITPTLWKGKEREIYPESQSDQDSTKSVLNMERPDKPPVHAMPADAIKNIPPPPPLVVEGPPSVSSDVASTQVNTAPSRPISLAIPEEVLAIASPLTAQAITAFEIPATPRAAPTQPAPAPFVDVPAVDPVSEVAPAEAPAPAPASAAETSATPEAAPNPSASLYSDLANLFTAAASVFAQHPELSEGLRNLVSNASSGAYLPAQVVANAQNEMQRGMEEAHRGLQEAQRGMQEAHQTIQRNMQQAQGEMQRSATEAQRTAQELAGQHIGDVMGSLFGNVSVSTAPPQTGTFQPPPRGPPVHNPWSPPGQGQGPMNHLMSNWLSSIIPPVPGIRPPQPPHGSGTPGTGVLPLPTQPTQPFVTTRITPPRPPQPFVPPMPRSGSVRRAPPPPPTIPGAGRRQVGVFPTGIPVSASGPGLSPTPLAPPPAPPVAPSAPAERTPREELEETKAAYKNAKAPASAQRSARDELEAAKASYKAAKARYRNDREARRLRGENFSGDTGVHSSSETERGFSTGVTSTRTPIIVPGPAPVTPRKQSAEVAAALASSPAADTTLVSAGRGGFPQYEMVNVTPPRRANTYSGPSPRAAGPRARPAPAQEGNTLVDSVTSGVPEREIFQRIKLRLADMGFSESLYPTLPSMIKMNLAGNMTPSADEEEEIVARLLEELLSFSPPRPIASGSNRIILD